MDNYSNSTLDYIYKRSKIEKDSAFTDILKDPDVQEYNEYYLYGITGSLGESPFQSKVAIDVKDLEQLLRVSFSQGVFYQRYKNKKDLDSILLNDQEH